jgi:hypothetical protein
MAMAHISNTLVVATLALGAGPVMFLRGFGRLRVRRLMQDTPSARIRSMAMGLVEVNGQVEARSQFTGPFSGRPCAYWEVDISTRTKNGWHVVHRNASGHPFFLRDATGVALVYPRGAESKVVFGVSEECNGLSLPECYATYFAEQHLALAALWRMGLMRFRERILEDGQQIFVLGTAAPKPHAVSLSDEDTLAATGTGDAFAARLQHTTDEVSAVIRQGENERTFVISQESERLLALELGASALGQLVGGPLFTLFGLGIWLDWLAHHRP